MNKPNLERNLLEESALILAKDKEKKNFVRDINALLRKSFLPGLSGIFSSVEGDRRHGWDGSTENEDGRLELIFERRFYLFDEQIGAFTNTDGSAMIVYPQYAEKALSYSKLYKQKYRKDVRIDLFNHTK